MAALGRAICKGDYSPVSNKFSADLRAIIGLMLQKDVSKRPSVDEILSTDAVMRRKDLCPTTLE